MIGVRFTQGNNAALPQAARELVEQGVDILFTVNPAPTKAAQMATSRIPIVFYGTGDPIGLGLIKSFARPGGNITGVTDLDLELDSKRLEIFKEMIPGIARVLFPYDPSEAFAVAQAKIYRESARRLKIMLIEKTVVSQKEAQATFDRSGKMRFMASWCHAHFPSTFPVLPWRLCLRSGFQQCFLVLGTWIKADLLATVLTSTNRGARQRGWWTRFLKGQIPVRFPLK